MNSAMRSVLCFVTTGCLLFLSAAPPFIGVIRSYGDFRVDGSTIRGNATLFEGDIVRTAAAQALIHLSSGTEIALAPGSRAQVYSDHTVLQQGTQTIKNAEKHLIEAATLRISPTDAHTLAEIVINASNRVAIAAREGPVEVRNGAGVLVATVHPGLALAFDTHAGAAASKMSGCPVNKGGKYLLTDLTTNVTVELQGSGVARNAGHLVQITGSMIPGMAPTGGASQVVHVATVDSVGAACGPSSRGGGDGAAAGQRPAAAIVAIVGGVAVAGTRVAPRRAESWPPAPLSP